MLCNIDRQTCMNGQKEGRLEEFTNTISLNACELSYPSLQSAQNEMSSTDIFPNFQHGNDEPWPYEFSGKFKLLPSKMIQNFPDIVWYIKDNDTHGFYSSTLNTEQD